ncbi:MAG: hypothetical protein PGN26_09095 [Xylophilus ampelinus]
MNTPFLTNFFGWEFYLQTEPHRGCWIGAIRIVSDEQMPHSTIRCRDMRSTEIEAWQDAKALAWEWSEKLERSPQSARFAAERELAGAPAYGLSGVFEEFDVAMP